MAGGVRLRRRRSHPHLRRESSLFYGKEERRRSSLRLNQRGKPAGAEGARYLLNEINSAECAHDARALTRSIALARSSSEGGAQTRQAEVTLDMRARCHARSREINALLAANSGQDL